MAVSIRNGLISLITATALMSPSYAADESQTPTKKGYAGVSVGQGTVEAFCDDADGFSCDDSAFALRMFAGTAINEYVGFEGGFNFLDAVTAEASGPGGTAKLEVDSRALDGTMTIGTSSKQRVRGFAKIGVIYYNLDAEISASTLSGDSFLSDSESGAALKSGLGLRARINEQVDLRLDWDYLIDVEDSDIHIFTVGPQFRF